MTTDVATFDIRVTGAEQSAARTEKVATAFKKLDTNAGGLGKQLQPLSGHFSKLSSLLNSIDPMIGSLTGTLGKATGAMTALSMSIGGPAGIAIGGVVGALALWNEHQEASIKKSEELAKSVQKQKLAFEDLVTGYRAALAQTNLGDMAEAMALRNQAANDKTLTPDRRAWLERRAQMIEDRDRAAAEKASYERENAAAMGEINAALSTFDEPGKGGKRSDKEWETVQRKEASSAQLRKLQEEQIRYEVEADRRAGEERLRGRLEMLNAEHEMQKSATERRIEMRRQEDEEYKRIDEQAAERRRLGQQVAIAGAQNVAGATTGALVKIAKGQKVSTAAFLESIGEQAIADGTFRILMGAGMLAGLNPAGAAVMAAGAAEVGFGVMLGAPARGQRGGGGGGGAAALGGGYSSEPTNVRRDEGPRETRSNIQVVVQTLVADERTGERVMQAIEAAHTKLGRKMAPAVVGRA